MSTQRPDDETILNVQRDLERLGARCRVCVKRSVRGRWERVHEGLGTFVAALDLAKEAEAGVVEVGIFLEHERYGTQIWTSQFPEVANRFDRYPI